LDELVGELADKLVKAGKKINTCSKAPFDERLMLVCEKCPEELPNLWRKELHREGIFGLLCHPELIEAVKTLIPADEIRIFPNYSARPKTPHAIHNVVWHQDAGLQADGSASSAPMEERLDSYGIGKVVNCWTPLVKVTKENGAMKFIPRSQKLGILDHEIGGVQPGMEDAPESQSGKFFTNVNAKDMAMIEHIGVDIECDPGDVVLFSNILVHCGG